MRESDLLSTETELFKPTPREISVESGRNTSVRPSDYTSSGPFIFDFVSQGILFYQFSKLVLNGWMQITKADGTACTEYENVSGINLLPSSLIQDIKIEINGKGLAEVSFLNL